jgi:hypothetical protein
MSMIRILAFLMLLASPVVAQNILFSAPVIPPQAAAAGFNTMTYQVTSFGAANVDTALSYASGKPLYIYNYFGTTPDATGIVFNADGSMQITGIPNSSSGSLNVGQVTSAGVISGGFVGTAFGGGAYFETVVRFDPSLYVDRGVSFWMMSIEHLAFAAGSAGQHWTGQAAGYDHFAEFDVVEVGSTSYSASLHDWYGIFNVTCFTPGVTNYCDILSTTNLLFYGLDWKQYHRVGFLWIPATGGSPGSAAWYIDDVMVNRVTWTQYVAASQSPPPVLGGNAFGVADVQHMAILIGTGHNFPLTVRSLKVWQVNSANNIVH